MTQPSKEVARDVLEEIRSILGDTERQIENRLNKLIEDYEIRIEGVELKHQTVFSPSMYPKVMVRLKVCL